MCAYIHDAHVSQSHCAYYYYSFPIVHIHIFHYAICNSSIYSRANHSENVIWGMQTILRGAMMTST
jgi:hypothetical protein